MKRTIFEIDLLNVKHKKKERESERSTIFRIYYLDIKVVCLW